jgi:hypothetical protein
MLRRAPTTITLTQADIERWEANRQRKIYEAQQQLEANMAAAQSTPVSAKPREQKQKTKKDRIMGETGN